MLLVPVLKVLNYVISPSVKDVKLCYLLNISPSVKDVKLCY